MRTIWWFGKSIRLEYLDMYNGHVPFLLSGGINSYSANALKEFKHPRLAGYDLNSRFELKPGEKGSGAYPDIFKRIKIII